MMGFHEWWTVSSENEKLFVFCTLLIVVEWWRR